MSGHEFKPGDVASVDRMGRREVAIFAADPAGWWFTQYGRAIYDESDGDPRPVLLIDPEDRNQIERLADVFCRFPSAGWVDQMQEALRSLLVPPRPDEPQEPLSDEELRELRAIIAERAS